MVAASTRLVHEGTKSLLLKAPLLCRGCVGRSIGVKAGYDLVVSWEGQYWNGGGDMEGWRGYPFRD